MRSPWIRTLLGWLKTTPVAVWIAGLVIAPNLILLFYSLWSSRMGVLSHELTLENYGRIFTSDQIPQLLTRTVVVASISALIATLLGFVIAYVVVRQFPRMKWVITMLVVIPLWISFLMRIFSWKVILGDQGVLNGLLINLGVIDKPASIFLYSPYTVVMALVYAGFPYAYLACFVTLNRIPVRLYEAAADLGGNGLITFRDVVWPIAKPASGLAFTLVFVIAYGDYITPALVGGLNGTMVGTTVVQAFGAMNNWPLGAALAETTLVTGLIVVALATLFTRNRVTLED